MTTIVNTPSSGESSDSGLGLIIGAVVAILLIALFFVYGLPALRQNNNQSGSTNTIVVPITGPAGATGATGATGPTGATGAVGI
jgi:hypothetical protein